ncbi:hypothetical protein [Microtetraspora glauca]|uniref:Uncharacterized protein n=1 Tax=Microtetraspora glauca TaxID=1996 RepID=A0ABV3GIP5_MICGL
MLHSRLAQCFFGEFGPREFDGGHQFVSCVGDHDAYLAAIGGSRLAPE